MTADLAAQRDHWPRVREMSCVICSSRPVQLHHCHGGSMLEIGVDRGASQKVSDWLVIPIHERFHVGEHGIDSGDRYWGVIENWEEAFGSQVSLLEEVCLYVGYNVFRRAGFDYDNYWIKHLP